MTEPAASTHESATSHKPRLNVIGCGRAAGSLFRLWLEARAIEAGDVLNRSYESAREACRRSGGGRPVGRLEDMRPAELWVIGTGDDQIADAAEALAHSTTPLDRSVVFHLAGRLGPAVLEVVAERGARIAAVHPVRSLTHDALRIEQFRGTACVAEGGEAALERLQPLMNAIGAKWLPVGDIDRGLYHAAVSIISNVTKAVAWKAQNWLQFAGLSEDTSAAVTHQLLRSTMDDLFRAGARQSITGPVVRGDTRTVEAHLGALARSYPADSDLYRVLARTVLELAQERGDLSPEALVRFKALLSGQERPDRSGREPGSAP